MTATGFALICLGIGVQFLLIVFDKQVSRSTGQWAFFAMGWMILLGIALVIAGIVAWLWRAMP